MELTKRRKYYSIKLFLVFLFIFILIGCTQKSNQHSKSLIGNQIDKTVQKPKESVKSNFLIYENPSDGIKIKYPADWVKDDVLGEISYFFHPKNKINEDYPNEGVIITPGVFENPIPLDEYAKRTLELQTEEFPDTTVIESSKTTLAGSPAKNLIIAYKDGNFNVKAMYVWTIKNNKMYMIAYTAEQDRYNTLLETAQEMINSFEIS
ncbi:hypothetical protein HYX00_06750 [Candidatus Woesearchaeota archaeon]|nr:hypothetical protein [Candidatus Woesearchaeota archaeon]